MKIVHLPSSFFPSNTGGKEVFVYQLVKNMPHEQHRVVIHSSSEESGVYEYDGIEVHRITKQVSANFRKSYYSLTYDELPGFREILETDPPDLVHFHDFCSGASLSHLRICKQYNIRTLLTYHAPGSTCVQQGLLYGGKSTCNGVVLKDKCTDCRYQVLGLPVWLSKLSSHVALPFDPEGKFILRNSTELFINSWKEFYEKIDGIQVHSEWFRDQLLQNGIPSTKIHFIAMGGHPTQKNKLQIESNLSDVLKLVFIGRCTEVKGVHILIDAILSLPKDKKIEVHFFGPYWHDSEYGRKMKDKIGSDLRFKMPRLVPPDQVIEELSLMDVCVVPSLWPETGPLTIFDAFAAGIPVIGTNHAGIAERVTDGVDGLLFKWGSSYDLADKIELILKDRSYLNNFRSSIKENNTFRKMALDMKALYSTILE